MMVDLNAKERDLLIAELEKTAIPDLRVLIASKPRKISREEMKQDEVILKGLLEKLKKAA